MSLSRSGAIARQELRVLRSDPAFLIISSTVIPLLLMALVKPGFHYAFAAQGHPAANGAEQAVPGMAVMFTLFLMSNVGIGFIREHGWGTWERLRASWASPSEIMVGKVAVPLLLVITQLVFLLGVGGVLFGLRVHGSIVALVAVSAVFCICVVALGLALFSLCHTAMQLNAISYLLALLFAGLGGAITPLSLLPGWARTIAPGAPSYWAMRGYRSVILGHAGLGDVIEPVAMLTAFAAVSLMVAGTRLRFEQTKTSFA